MGGGGYEMRALPPQISEIYGFHGVLGPNGCFAPPHLKEEKN